MRMGFIKPNYPNERRVCLLPEHVPEGPNALVVEAGFGETMDIDDGQYRAKGCVIADRQEVFRSCEAIVSLKLIQPSDYGDLRDGQIIIGWTHPTGSGAAFMRDQAIPRKLFIADLDNIYPRVWHGNEWRSIDFLDPNFIYKNSVFAGAGAVYHAFLAYGKMPDGSLNAAVLSAGNVAQGAMQICSRLGLSPRMYTRKTMHLFKEDLEIFDVIVNGIEIDRSKDERHILGEDDLGRLKKNCLLIDAAADAGQAIFGTEYTSLDNPFRVYGGIYYYCVNNAGTVFFRDASREISKVFSAQIYNVDPSIFVNLFDRQNA